MARKRKVSAAELTQNSADDLMEDLQSVLEDAEALLSATAGQAGERIQQVRARAEETVRQVRDRLTAATRTTMCVRTPGRQLALPLALPFLLGSSPAAVERNGP